MLNENVEAFVVHVSSLRLRMSIHPARKAQLALLLTKKVTLPIEYLDFADIFLEKSANVLPELTRANEHIIKLEEGKQLLYKLIYSLGRLSLRSPRPTLTLTWQMVLSGHQSHQRVIQFCFSVSPIVAFACVSITKNSITLQSKIGIHYYLLASL